MQNLKKYCNNSTSWNCCFSRDTKIMVNENNKIIEKKIYEIKKDDLILTLMKNLNFMNLNV